VAETVSPSVRGMQRVRVVAILLLAGMASGGLVGFLPGAAWQGLGLPAMATDAAALLAGVALIADIAGRPAPLAVRRQVPQLWGRIFGPGTAALLYGARLGVGPLTILTSWQWWAATVIGITHGPWAGAATGVVFHATRTVTMLAAVAGAEQMMPSRMAAVRRRERPVAAAGWLAVAAAALLVVAACSGEDGQAVLTSSSTTSTSRSSTTTTTTTVALTTTSTTTATPEETALMSVLLEEALPGFRRYPDLETPDLDLAGAAALEEDTAAERSLLETRGFVRGTSRAWRNDDRDVALVTLYEFADASGAAAYLADGAEHLQARGAQTFDVADLPEALGFTQVDETSEGAFTGHGIAFTRGNRYVLVVVGSSSSGVSTDDARRLAAAQAALL